MEQNPVVNLLNNDFVGQSSRSEYEKIRDVWMEGYGTAEGSKVADIANEYSRSIARLKDLQDFVLSDIAALVLDQSKFLLAYVDLSNKDIPHVASIGGVGLLKKLLDQFDLLVRHPETGEPSIVLYISDDYGGRFVLEGRVTRKRSMSTKRLLPLLAGGLAHETEVVRWASQNTDVKKSSRAAQRKSK